MLPGLRWSTLGDLGDLPPVVGYFPLRKPADPLGRPPTSRGRADRRGTGPLWPGCSARFCGQPPSSGRRRPGGAASAVAAAWVAGTGAGPAGGRGREPSRQGPKARSARPAGTAGPRGPSRGRGASSQAGRAAAPGPRRRVRGRPGDARAGGAGAPGCACRRAGFARLARRPRGSWLCWGGDRWSPDSPALSLEKKAFL